jgi:hypothetical protein
MNFGVDQKRYQILIVWCHACGHCGHVDPKRGTPGRRFRCRKSGIGQCQFRMISHEEAPPDNVILLTRGRLK